MHDDIPRERVNRHRMARANSSGNKRQFSPRAGWLALFVVLFAAIVAVWLFTRL